MVLIAIAAGVTTNAWSAKPDQKRHNKHLTMGNPNASIQLIPEALGTYRWPISTDNPQAQAFFDQGMQLRWAYNMPESIASMVKARELDPSCAMCFGAKPSRGAPSSTAA